MTPTQRAKIVEIIAQSMIENIAYPILKTADPEAKDPATPDEIVDEIEEVLEGD